MSDINASNYRQCANDAIQKLSDNGAIVDVIVWSQIIGLYEAEIARLKNAADLADATIVRLRGSK